MRYTELFESPIKYYHGSKKKFPVGFKLLPQPDGYASSTDEFIEPIEKILEYYKPANLLSRYKCIYMVSTPDEVDYAGGYTDYIYEVNPIAPIERNDMAWYSELNGYTLTDLDTSAVKNLALGYWSGKQFEDGLNSLWEYRAPSALIIKMIEDNT